MGRHVGQVGNIGNEKEHGLLMYCKTFPYREQLCLHSTVANILHESHNSSVQIILIMRNLFPILLASIWRNVTNDSEDLGGAPGGTPGQNRSKDN